jgi:cobalamin-dependent methionine synthase I
MTKDALAEGRPVQEVLTEGLIAGMSVVGEDFKHNVLYVPEVLIAARAMKAGMAVLKPLLSSKDGNSDRAGVLLMGTVRGDLHDIGKNLVCMMAEGAGFEVYDIGVDQSVEKFMAAADRVNATIVDRTAIGALAGSIHAMPAVVSSSSNRLRNEITGPRSPSDIIGDTSYVSRLISHVTISIVSPRSPFNPRSPCGPGLPVLPIPGPDFQPGPGHGPG